MRRTGDGWPPGRAAAFCGGGLGVIVIATMSFLGVYQWVLFYVRAVQTVLLLLAAPLFLALGRPVSLADRRLRRGSGARVEALVAQPAGPRADLPRHHRAAPWSSSASSSTSRPGTRPGCAATRSGN